MKKKHNNYIATDFTLKSAARGGEKSPRTL